MAVTWATDADVTGALGVPVTDAAWLATVTAAANAMAYRLRIKAGYFDDPATVPSADVKLAVILLAKDFHNQRGAGSQSFASFEQFAETVTPGTMATVAQLLGARRAQAW